MYQKTAWLGNKVNFKIYDVTTWEANNCNTLNAQYLDLNQAMAFGQLIEYNMKIIFLEKSFTECGEENFTNSFLKNQNGTYLWIGNRLKFYQVYFYWMPSWGLSKNIKTKLQITCFYSNKAYLKTKRRSRISLQPHFLYDFWRKILQLYSSKWPNFIIWLLLLRQILGNISIVIASQVVTS